ncbi:MULTISPECIES: sensor histidine kinase [Rossellomorea]|uniref:sensor histidine kinase n=1 Tax=Rossellomorea TaxID=2837508 RepID=UPI000B1B0418|nr:sensor histidine kinase [Rossellomorea marisflavi]
MILMNHVPMVRTGIVTGIMVAVFRTLTSHMFIADPGTFFDALLIHIPAMFYYITFAIGLSLIPLDWIKSKLLILGVSVVGIDVASNVVEIGLRKWLMETTPLLWTEWSMLVLVAVIRVFFVIGLYANIILHQLRALHQEQQLRYEKMLTVGSSLYSESFYMNKMIDSIEELTLNSYRFYKELKAEGLNLSSAKALEMAEETHELKKDAQRIMAGLKKLNGETEIGASMGMVEIMDFVKKANEQYSRWLGKNIIFIFESKGQEYRTNRHLALLTVLNNLVANGVEAIPSEGTVKVEILDEGALTVFIVTDSGGGIREDEMDFICEPGFTTKFNQEGVAATGIGLSHVKNILESLDGKMDVRSIEKEGTTFTLKIPKQTLLNGGEYA